MAKKYNFDVKKLCTPSFLYFSLSMFALLIRGIQNVMNKDDSTLKLSLSFFYSYFSVK